MAYIKTIYLPTDVGVLLEKQENVSGFIAKLLKEHFKQNRIDGLTIAEIQQRKAQIASGISIPAEAEIKALTEIEQEMLKTEEEKKTEETAKIQRRRETITNALRDELGYEPEQRHIDIYIERWDSNRFIGLNIFDYALEIKNGLV